MANIVIFHFSGIIKGGQYVSSCYYDGMISSFREEGHNVFHVITSDYLLDPWNGNNTNVSDVWSQELVKEVKDFKPDLVISFNNSIVSGVVDVLDCPILLWDADQFEYFSDKDTILKNQDRYVYGAHCTLGLQKFKELINHGGAEIGRLLPATAVKSDFDCKKEFEISFIGSPFFNELDFSLGGSNVRLKARLDDGKFHRRSGLVYCLSEEFRLGVFGPHEWMRLAAVDASFLKAYKGASVVSLDDNQNIHNASVLGLNITHGQGLGYGFSWRVPDIMASSALLLTNPSENLIELAGFVRDISFESSSELREMAIKFLGDDGRRLEYVYSCHDLVERRFRWKDRITEISSLTGVDLTTSNERGSYYRPVPEIAFVYKLAAEKLLNFNNNLPSDFLDKLRSSKRKIASLMPKQLQHCIKISRGW